jgi:Reverse transcriptase (RNA-dependent DNA polymerase)
VTQALFYDFSKAFDTLSHDILVAKLESYGIRGIAGQWIKSFLSNRKQQVELSHLNADDILEYIYSDLLENDVGIAQGSILGPLTFNVFINDLALLCLIGLLIIFADDSNKLIKAKSRKELYYSSQLSNESIEKWSAENNLLLNAQKTTFVQFCKPRETLQSSPLLRLNGQIVHGSECTKFLGVHINEKLDWKQHCAELVSKLNKCAFMFSVLRKSVQDLNTLKSVYFAHVQSHLQYAIIIWGDSSDFESVFLVQKKILRGLVGLRFKRWYKALASCNAHFKRLKILTLPSLYILECCKFYRKFPHYFTQNTQTHDYNTRRRHDILINTTLPSPKHKVSQIYNKLPRSIKSIASYKNFVSKLYEFLVEKCYYKISDYQSEIWQS